MDHPKFFSNPPSDLTGKIIKGYEVREWIGSGGTSVVYRAYHPVIGREVALKIIQPQFANHPDFIRRFAVEAQTIAGLEHPFIVPLYDHWREPNSACLVTRFLRGGNLCSLLGEQPVALDVLVRLLDQVVSALAFAHHSGVIHSDLKPYNILLDDLGNAYLADFGIAKDLNHVQDDNSRTMVGSPAYLAPEQILKQPLSIQTDIYSLGIVLFELLAGQHPFADLDSTTLLLKHLQTPMPSLQVARPDLPPQLDDVLQKATSKVPQERFTDAPALLAAFKQAIATDNANIASVGQSRPGIAEPPEFRNPYKGLRPFQEADAADFFGRESVVAHLLQQLNTSEGPQFLAIVGPSGSGKSSVVRAGIIPALRRNALPGSSRWYLIEMLPGQTPLQELATALLRIAANPLDDLLEQLQADENGLLHVIEQILPDNDTELILFIDQFEEVFTLDEDEKSRTHFLNSLGAAVKAPYSRVHVIITLRADFYDRPLLYAEFSNLMRLRTEVIVPMPHAQLEEAIVGPAQRVGLALEPGLKSQIISDLSEQPGTLPLLQYTLTELFARRQDKVLTLNTYHSIGGVLGALARRAEDIYRNLNLHQQKATRQVFLRLVNLGEGTEDTRRRVPRVELLSIGIDNQVLETILDIFGKYRLLTFDHEPTTRAPTVEIAHEALIKTWERLHEWIDATREDLRLHRRLSQATSEWLSAGQDDSFLATGTRLEQFEAWAINTPLMLNKQEETYLRASMAQRKRKENEETERHRREIALERRSRRRLQALVGILFVAALGAFLLTAWALRESQKAKENEREARRSAEERQSLALATSARQALRDNNPDLAIALALQAASIADPPPQTQQILAEAVYSAGTRSRLELPDFARGITTLAVGTDGRTLLIAYNDRTLRLWDTQTQREVRVFQRHDALIYGLAYATGGRRAIAGTGMGRLFLWDTITGELIRNLDGHEAPITVVVFHPNGLTAASASRRGEVILWNLTTGEPIARFESPNNSWVTQLDFSPDRQMIVAGSLDGTICIWHIPSASLLRCIETGQIDVMSVAFSPDNLQVVSGGTDYSVMLWDVATGGQLWRSEGHSGTVNDIDFSNDGRTLISGADDNLIILWDVETGEEIRRFVGHSGPVKQISFSHSDDRSAISISDDGSMRLWDVESGAQLKRLVGHGAEVTSIAFSPDGKMAISGSRDRSLILWDLITGEEIRRFEGHTEWVSSVAFSPMGDTIVSGSLDSSIIIWDVDTGNILHQFNAPDRMTSLVYTADGSAVLAGLANGEIRLWDTETEAQIQRFIGHSAQVTGIAFNFDNSMIVSSSSDGNIRLWDVASGSLIRTLDGGSRSISSVTFSPDGRFILSGSGQSDGFLRLWDVASGQEIRRFIGHSDAVTSVAFSPNGLTVLSASYDRSVRLWDVSTGDEIARFDGHTDIVTSVTFSADGRTALSASRDRTLRLWRTFGSLEELIEYANANRYIKVLGCEEREKYLILPICKPTPEPPTPSIHINPTSPGPVLPE